MIKELCYNILMRFNKDGSPDKRFKSKNSNQPIVPITLDEKESLEDVFYCDGLSEKMIAEAYLAARKEPINIEVETAQQLFEKFLTENNLQLDFDVIEGTIPTKFGFVKLDKPTLSIKATYVTSK